MHWLRLDEGRDSAPASCATNKSMMLVQVVPPANLTQTSGALAMHLKIFTKLNGLSDILKFKIKLNKTKLYKIKEKQF